MPSKRLFFLKSLQPLFRRNLPNKLKQRETKKKHRRKQTKRSRSHLEGAGKKTKQKKTPDQHPFPGPSAPVCTTKKTGRVPTGLLSGCCMPWVLGEKAKRTGLRSVCDDACVRVVCTEAALGWVWSPGSSCTRWTGLGSPLARLWPVEPCWAHGCRFGPCNLWREQTEEEEESYQYA